MSSVTISRHFKNVNVNLLNVSRTSDFAAALLGGNKCDIYLPNLSVL